MSDLNDFGDETLKQNPIFKIMNSGNNNNNLNDTTGIQNPMGFLNNANNLDNSTMINPFFGNMNQGQNLDDMLNEMSKVLLNLQSDMSKVMTGINQLNLLISNIQKYRANNNINNNMINNNMINNNMMGIGMMSSNNMMNNDINNMMNNFNNMNNLINNNINNINPMMGNLNMNMNQYINFPKFITVIFREAGEIGDNYSNKIPIMMDVKEDEKISDIIQKYRQKSSNYDINLKFIWNAKDLNHSLTVAEAGLTNTSNIFVVKARI